MQEAAVADIENLTGSANADILAGDLRNNTIMGGGGDDKIYGGPNPADADKEGGSGIENNDTLHGDGGNDMIFGGFGNDVIRGGAGNDMLNGGAGNDTFWGGHGSDMIYADAADRVIYGNQPDNFTPEGVAIEPATADVDESMEMMGDVDTLSYAKLEDGVTRTLGSDGTGADDATDGSNVLIMGIENIIGTQGVDNLTGDANNNVIEGGESGDTLSGAAGEDTLSYEGSDDWVRVTLNGTDGDTSPAATTSRGHASGDNATNFENVRGSAFDDDLTGDVNPNKLWGLAGDDDIDGAGGNDTIEGGAGADELDGGYTDGDTTTDGNQANSEVNTLSYATSDARVTVNLMTASASGGHATGDTIETYEELAPTDDDEGNEIDVATFRNVTGSMHDDHLTGNQYFNVLNGGAGDDTLRGMAGADHIIGGPGADTLDGGEDMNERNNMVPGVANVDDDGDGTTDEEGEMAPASIDWAVYRDAMEGVMVDLSTNRGTGGEAMGDTLVNIELIWGSKHDDTIIASSGADLIHGDGGSDTVSYEASSIGVTVNLTTDNTIATATGTGTEAAPFVFPEEADPAIGDIDAEGVAAILQTPGADPDPDDNPDTNGATGDRLGSIENLTGSDHKDSLTGDANPNVLKGMGGDDILAGGANNDKLYGGDGDDMLSVTDGANMLDGGAGDDTITGGSGDDTINGGAGDDQLIGTGGGNDTFVFSPDDGDGDDVITGFGASTDAVGDKIDLSAYDLTAEQLMASIDTFGGNVRIDLTAFGGGKILLSGVTDIDDVDAATGGDDTDGELDMVSIVDSDGNGVFIL